MNNFRRALKLALRYRGRLIVSLICALFAAALWSLNIAAIYPVLQLVEKKKNLQDWSDGKLSDLDQQIAEKEREIEAYSNKKKDIETWQASALRDDELRKVVDQLHTKEAGLASLRARQWRHQQLKHYAIRRLPTDMFDTLAVLLGIVVVAVAVRGFFEFWQEYLVGIVVARTILDIRNKFYRAAIHQDLRQIQEGGSAELMSRFTNDMEAIGNGMKILFGKVIAEPLKAVACLGIAFWVSWQLTLLFVLIVPLAIFIMTTASKKMKKASRRVLEKMGSLYKILQETFQGLRVVKAFTMEPYERRRFHDAAKEYAHRSIRVTRIDALTSPLVELTGVVAILLSVLAGAYLVISGEKRIWFVQLTSAPLDMAGLAMLYAQLIGMADPIRKLSSIYTKLQSSAAACDRVFAAMDRVPQVQANPEGPRLGRHNKEIEFVNVCFSYTPDRPILNHVCLKVNSGETIAVVGANGTGKSTLLNLLPRFFDPDFGVILVDGIDIRKANLRSLRKQIALVSQDPILFDDTIAKNILYGNRNATHEQIEDAAKKAFAHDFIMSKGGYEVRLGDLGSSLSGGEKQRIALARAILRDPSILILDEFSSAIDPVSDRLIHDALQDFKRGRTTFFITHKMHTVQMADRIVVLDNQAVAATGTHAELIVSSPVYRALYDAQIHGKASDSPAPVEPPLLNPKLAEDTLPEADAGDDEAPPTVVPAA
jgi:ATP-binding cassette, subfamily B, bacterial MsbA